VTPLTAAKVALFIIAAILIGFGIRADSSALRITGIGFLVAAFALRFVKKDLPE